MRVKQSRAEQVGMEAWLAGHFPLSRSNQREEETG